MSRLFVTGFGPFLDVADNPSAILARNLGLPHEILEVSFQDVDRFLAQFKRSNARQLLMVGVGRRRRHLAVELFGRNAVGAVPDVRGEVLGPGPISPEGPPILGSTLWQSPVWARATRRCKPSLDAGDYLCNYALYRALTTLPEVAVGFLHVPPFEALSEPDQRLELERIVQLLQGAKL